MQSNLQSTFSMLDIFVQSGEITELRETYYKKIALPIIREANKDWNPKTIHEAHSLLKQHLQKEKQTKPEFII